MLLQCDCVQVWVCVCAMNCHSAVSPDKDSPGLCEVNTAEAFHRNLLSINVNLVANSLTKIEVIFVCYNDEAIDLTHKHTQFFH